MRVAVCIKDISGEINPFDACALECALRIQDAEVIVLSMGRPSSETMLRALTRLSVSRVILLTDSAFAGADTLATSYTLALALRKIQPDLVLCGRQSIDGDTAQVGPSLATMLGYEFALNTLELNCYGNRVHCVTRTGEEDLSLPALVTVERINVLRFPKLCAQSREIEIWDADAIGADKERCGTAGSPTHVLTAYESSEGRRSCKFISKDEFTSTIAAARRKTSFIQPPSDAPKKLAKLWTVGDGLDDIARSVANCVIPLGDMEPKEIASRAMREMPDAILWPADERGKRNAPVAAAILQTGLCADCIKLETDGANLFFYRPAFGGSIMAKIACRTRPQMATVRTGSVSQEEIIIACGRGAVKHLEAVWAFAERLGASRGASRGLVDSGLAPYELQIGLTGKRVAPRVYIACGIGGSVQHTCAIERAGTIIAINPDKNARIFEYADYGVQCTAEEIF